MTNELLRTARFLARPRRSARRGMLRRSVSTAYYALFHAICELTADTLVGSDAKGSDSWSMVYRSVDHGNCRRVLEALRLKPETRTSAALMRLVDAFVDLQREREAADYDPRPFTKSTLDVANLIDAADRAIGALHSLGEHERLAIAVWLFVRDRRRSDGR